MHTSRWKRTLQEWLKAGLFAVLVVTALHVFVVQPFIVPTPSMARTVLPGDYILVSKLHYGPQTPQSVGIPFLNVYVPGLQLPSTRLPGLTEPERGDVVVFRYPVEEKPINQKTAYLKRLVGLPGDTVEVKEGRAVINGRRLQRVPTLQQRWKVQLADPRMQLHPSHLRPLGVTTMKPTSDPRYALVDATSEAADQLRSLSIVERVEPFRTDQSVGFPEGTRDTRDEYGPVPIPKAGQTVVLSDSTWPLYKSVIRRYEGHEATKLKDGTFVIDGTETSQYTFEQDYFFVMGDNRDNSLDSRFWGYVPKDHVVGQAVGTVLSWDPETNSPRFNRMLRSLD